MTNNPEGNMPLGGSAASLFFSLTTVTSEWIKQCTAPLKRQPHREKYAKPSIAASVSNISDWLYGKNVKDPIFSIPWALHLLPLFSYCSLFRPSQTQSPQTVQGEDTWNLYDMEKSINSKATFTISLRASVLLSCDLFALLQTIWH